MTKINILHRKKFDDFSIYFNFRKFEEIHVLLIELMADLGMGDRDELDIVYDDLCDQLFHFHNPDYLVNIIVFQDSIGLFMKSRDQLCKNELIRLIRVHFNY
jgi:hypothetical protein